MNLGAMNDGPYTDGFLYGRDVGFPISIVNVHYRVWWTISCCHLAQQEIVPISSIYLLYIC